MARWIPTGSSSLDIALDGGLSECAIILLYGAAETGKTALAIQCAVNAARVGYKTLYIDCDGDFPPERLLQIASRDFDNVSDYIILVKPSTFDEQAEIVENLEKFVASNFGLIIVDTVTSLYRLELLDKKETFGVNRELNRQIAMLTQIAKTLELPVLIVSQVSSKTEEAAVSPVATRVLKYWSDVTICLSRVGQKNMVKASVERRGGKEPQAPLYLVISEDGIRDCEALMLG